jgi:hypothetical protein
MTAEKPYPFNEAQLAWLHDLETTEEPQTRGMLFRPFPEPGIHTGDDDFAPGYCCLGRAIVVLETGDNLNWSLPSEKTAKLLRLRDSNGSFSPPVDDRNCLAQLNDDGWSFKKIAAYIRANPENVFLPPEGDAP